MLLDSSIVVELFRHKRTSKFFREVMKKIGEQPLFVSMIELAEVADWCLRNSIPAQTRIAAISEFAQIIPLDEAICQQAAIIKKDRRTKGYSNFGLIDGIIVSSATAQNQEVLTLDPDFEGEKDCFVLRL